MAFYHDCHGSLLSSILVLQNDWNKQNFPFSFTFTISITITTQDHLIIHLQPYSTLFVQVLIRHFIILVNGLFSVLMYVY